MIVSSDPDYLDTKLIKQGIKKLESNFQELADWINLNFKTKVLNVYYEIIDGNKNQQRLSIIFEFEQEAIKFENSSGFADEIKERIIIEKFIDITNNRKNSFKKLLNLPTLNLDPNRLFVIFEAFEPIARQEVNNKISTLEIDDLKKELESKNIWEIYREFEITTFFFYTNKQIEEYTKDGTTEVIRQKYFHLLKKYDEFDYIKSDTNFMDLDSKQNFDKNYKSNWFYYYKR